MKIEMFRKKLPRLIFLLPITFVTVLAACSSEPAAAPTARATSAQVITEATAKTVKQYNAPPAAVIDPSKKYTAVIEMEKGGEIVIELFASETPNTVNNFVFLAREGFYDGVTFHRVIEGFMAQDPTGTGSGGPGYRFADEFSPKLKHDSPGTLSMANAGPNTNGSQFFITLVPTPHLDGDHTLFGKVVEGMSVVNNISIRDPASARTPGDAIKTIRIQESEPEPTSTTKEESSSSEAAMQPKQYDAPPAMVIDPSKKYTATFEMENGGEFVVELFASDAPKTVNNFVFLSRDGFYDGITFHRVIPAFMAQAGDPTGTGSGGPGYRFEDEFSPNLKHDVTGILSMANAGPNTNGSQFFIIFTPTPHLDGVHTVFGKVVEGMDVVNAISVRDPASARTPGDAIKTIRIEESE